MNIKIGTRGSALALRQTHEVIAKLKKQYPSDTFEIVTVSTKGDLQLDRDLKSFGGEGVFIKEIEAALLRGDIDMAVHSAKDMPTAIPDGLEISAAPVRADRRDVLVCVPGTKDIKIIGTGSARRAAQAKEVYKSAEFRPIRGNIGTRLDKVKNGEYDAVIMAMAALDRLGTEDMRRIYFDDDFICAAGQGVIAVETVRGEMSEYAKAINDSAVMAELMAERAFIRHVGGGCHAPCGASAVYDKGRIKIKTFFSGIRLEATGDNPEKLGEEAAKKTLDVINERKSR